MDNKECSCSEKIAEMTCRTCSNGDVFPYWCETCQQPVAYKRCPDCGLKSRKIRPPG